MRRAVSGLVLVMGAVACGAPSPAPRSIAGVASTSSAARPSSRRSWLVVSPHPDDAALVAAGAIARAVEAGEPVTVVVLTNGDYECVVDGIVREREDIAGFRDLGLRSSQVFFLGYPDGALSKLGNAPLWRKRIENGHCVSGDTTYGAFGFEGTDVHRARTGAPALYTRANAVADLAGVIERVKPTDVIVTHPDDVHPDHATAYTLLREALDRFAVAPRIHRAIVHDGDCWPTGPEPTEPCPPAVLLPDRPLPALTGRLAGYEPRERVAVPADFLRPNPTENPKILAIAAHTSQTRGTYGSYLFAFARSDEIFFPETLDKRGGHWLRTGTLPLDAMHEADVDLRRGETRTTPMSVPLAIALRLGKGSARVDFLEDASGGYALEIDDAHRTARWIRNDADAKAPVVLADWPLPDDLWSEHGEESIELRLDARPEDGSVAELSFSLRGELWGVAVDVRPRASGHLLSVAGEPTKGDEVLRARVWTAAPK